MRFMPVLTPVCLILAGWLAQAGGLRGAPRAWFLSAAEPLAGFQAAISRQEGQTIGAAARKPPKAARDAFEKAAKAAQDKKPDEAIRNYRKAVALYPGYAEAWCELGKLQLAQNQLDDARTSLAAAIQANPDYLEPYKSLTVLENKAKNWKELVNVTDRLLKLSPAANWQAWFFNAIGNYNAQNFEAAEKSAREAERLDTQHQFPTTWQLLGGLLARRGDLAGAAEQYRGYLKWKPDAPDAETIRARLADMEKRAGPAPPPAPASATFRADTNLALVRFQVIPQKGQFVTDLRPEDIEIREDGIPRQIGLFEGGRFYPRTVPLEIALLFDCSGSVQDAGTLDPHVFDENLLREYENAAIAIYAFSDNLVRLTGPTRDGPALIKAMDAVGTFPTGDTPLFGDIAETARDAASSGSNATRMMVILSDGESTRAGDTLRSVEAIQVAQDLGIALCPVMLAQPAVTRVNPNPDPGWELYRMASINAFMNLAKATGGREFSTVASREVVPTILKSLAQHVRYDYVVGFYPSSSGEHKRHKLEVVLRSKTRGQIVGGSRTLVH
jgi:VWFA-related protein